MRISDWSSDVCSSDLQIQVNNIGAYFGWDYIDVDAFTAGTITIGFIFGAYMAETFRGAFLAVPVGLLEAGYAYGMSKHQVFFRILVPQMMRHALPGLGNNWLVLMKMSAERGVGKEGVSTC